MVAAGGGETAGPRRSARTRNRTPLKPPPPLAAAALSLIPVRLPGSLNMGADDGGFGIPTLNSSSSRRRDEKDLAAETRVNTRKNKGNAEHPRDVLARQAADPAWRIRELKSVLEARDAAAAAASEPESEEAEAESPGAGGGAKKDGVRRKAKAVRWADALVRVQGEDGEVPAAPAKEASAATTTAAVPAASADTEETAETRPQTEAQEPSAPPAVVEAKKTEEKKQQQATTTGRRTRASRLPPPTPSKVLLASSAAAQAATAAAEKEKAPPPPPPSTKVVRMATRRSRISSLGMSGNGTPAPKRRAGRSAS